MYLIIMEVNVTMSLFKKITAILMSAAILASLSACGESTRWGAKINGKELKAGIYIYYSMNAYYDAQEFLKEGQTDVFAINIEDKPAVKWMQDKATENMQEYVAVEEKFDELGLTLTEDEIKSAENMIEQMWEYYGSYYEEHGISKQSNIDIRLNALKKEAIFKHYYAEGGTEAVAEDTIRQYMKDNYAYVNYIAMQLKDGEGNLLKSDGKAKIKEMAEDYIKRAKNGEDFNKIAAEYDKYYSDLQAKAQEAAQATETSAANNLTVETSPAQDEPAQDESNETSVTTASATETTTAVTEAAAETTENTVEDNSQVIKKDGTTPSKTVNEKVFSGDLKDGDIVLIEEDEVYYVLKYMDLFSKENYYEDNKNSVLHEIKDEEFNALVSSWTEKQSVEINQKAYDRYDIKKFAETESEEE
jgi:hypothetical protein